MTGLEYTTISLNLGQSLDQKTNPLVQEGNTFIDVKDSYYSKFGILNKRYGTIQEPINVMNDFSNALGIGSSSIPSYSMVLNDQLLMQNRGAVYSWIEAQDKWSFVGHHYPLTISNSVVAANNAFNNQPDCALFNNWEVYTYVRYDIGTSPLTQYIKYTIVDQSTGNKIINDVTIDSTSAFGFVMIRPMVITFASALYIVYINGADLVIVPINTSTGAIGSLTNLKTDVETFSFPNFPSTPQWTYTNQFGEIVFLTYPNNSGQLKIIGINNTGALTAHNFNDSNNFSSNDITSSGTSLFFAGGISQSTPSTNQGTVMRTLTFTSTTLTSVSNHTRNIQVTSPGMNPRRMSFVHAPTALIPSGLMVFGDFYQTQSINSQDYFELATVGLEFNSTTNGVALAPYEGIGLAAEPYYDASRATVYMPAEYPSDVNNINAANFLIDVFQGKNDSGSAFCIGKFNNSTAFVMSPDEKYTSGGIPSLLVYGDGRLALPSMVKGADSSIVVQTTANGTAQDLIQFVTTINKNTIDLTPENSASRANLNGSIYLSGGFLTAFDGSQIYEDNFFIQPDLVEANNTNFIQFSANMDYRVHVTTFVAGDGTHAGQASFDFPGGAALNDGTIFGLYNGPSNFLAFTTYDSGGADRLYYVWFKIDGVGTAPTGTGGTTVVEVDISKSDTGNLIANKVLAALFSSTFADDFQLSVLNDSLIVTNLFNGAIGADIIGFTGNFNAYIGDGSYQYCIVLSSIDNNGRLHRSAPSVPVTVVVTNAGGINVVNFVVPPLTNRQCQQVGIEVYRTVANGTIFYRVTPFPLMITMTPTTQYYSYFDTTSASSSSLPDITANEELYTNGGVLPNYQISPCNQVATFKNRLAVSGPFPNQIYYSNQAIYGSAVEFSEILFIALSEDTENIVGLAQMDDKLVTFKDHKIVYFVGDGANELGENSTFSDEIFAAIDVGCKSQNSIELTPAGLLFQSSMGIALFGRDTNTTYPGLNVKDYNSFRIGRSLILKDDSEIRQIRFVLMDQPYTLVFDYVQSKWTVFSNYGGDDAVMWKGQFTRIDSSGLVYVEDKSKYYDSTPSTTVPYNQTLTTAWLKLKNIQDFQRIKMLMVLGALKSANNLNFSIYYDYDETNSDLYTFPSSSIGGTSPGDSVYDPEVHLRRQKCQSIKIQMEVVSDGTGTQECLSLTDMAFIAGIKRGLFKVKAGKQI